MDSLPLGRLIALIVWAVGFILLLVFPSSLFIGLSAIALGSCLFGISLFRVVARQSRREIRKWVWFQIILPYIIPIGLAAGLNNFLNKVWDIRFFTDSEAFFYCTFLSIGLLEMIFDLLRSTRRLMDYGEHYFALGILLIILSSGLTATVIVDDSLLGGKSLPITRMEYFLALLAPLLLLSFAAKVKFYDERHS